MKALIIELLERLEANQKTINEYTDEIENPCLSQQTMNLLGELDPNEKLILKAKEFLKVDLPKGSKYSRKGMTVFKNGEYFCECGTMESANFILKCLIKNQLKK